MLNRSITTTLAALAIAGASVTAAYASEEALLDALVKKGVLKQADAQKIKAESARGGSAGNSKIKLNESVKELSLYGDLRLRWQHAQANAQTAAAANSFQDQASRFRLAIGGNFKLTDGLSAGVELATQSAANQRYVTFGQGDPIHAAGAGMDYSLYLSKAFIGWNPSKEFSVTAGRQSIPFYSTEMVWDNDVRLDGVTEKIDLGSLLGLGDGFHLHFIAGQFIGGNNFSFNAAGTPENRDGWLFQGQLKAVADLGGAKLTFAPGFQFSSAKDSFGGLTVDNQGVGGLPGGASTQSLENLRVILAPGDISFDVAGTKAKFLWDFAYNFGANAGTGPDDRLIAPISATQDRMAWLLGIQVGENKNAGDFSVFANYREVGAGALNTFYSDSDFALGQSGNQRGFKVGAKYSFTKNATLTAAYTASSNIDADVDVNAVKPQTLSGLNSSQLVTIDLGLKF